MVATELSGATFMSDIIFVPEYAYSIKEIDFDDFHAFNEQWDWDGISKIKITQYGPMGNQSFWLESLKNWNYEKNEKWLNDKAKIAIKWIKENHPELML